MKLLIAPFLGAMALFVSAPATLRAQAPEPAATEPADWLIHGQTTYILQGHGAFTSPYEGLHSLQPRREAEGSFSATLYLGWRPWEGGELYVTPELLGGKGLSSVVGVAGETNGEIYRVNNPQVRPSLSRIFLRQTWNLPGGAAQAVEDGPMNLSGTRSSRRFTVTAGKIAMNDIFDVNGIIADPRSGFMNWSLMDTGSWDYPADTRGYSWGLTLELTWDAWAARLGSYMEPKSANQMQFDPQISRAHGDVLELEHDHTLLTLPGKVSVLFFANHARMGNYQEALAQSPSAPDILATRSAGRTKYGSSVNVEQGLTPDLGMFFRAGWNDGKTESWAFTEIDKTVAGGLVLQGGAWGRSADRLGAGFIVNGLSTEHKTYLAAGGYGFLIGDGRLDYAPEKILESYYSVATGKHVFLSADYQRIWNPAYNQDRGPVNLYALRVHMQF